MKAPSQITFSRSRFIQLPLICNFAIALRFYWFGIKHTVFCRVIVLSLTFGLLPNIVFGDSVEIDITGVEGARLQNVVSFMTFFQQAEDSKSPLALLHNRKFPKLEMSERQVKRAHSLAEAEIQQALQPFGYYDVKVRDELTQTDKGWSAKYKIIPGKPTMVRSVQIELQGEGQSNEKLKAIVEETRIASGKQLSHSAYDETKSALIEAAYQAGYLDADFKKSEIRVEPKIHSADIELRMDTGPLFYFGEIHFEQNALDTAIINRFLPFKSDEPFDASKLTALQLNLEDTDYFSEIEIQAQRDRAIDQKIPVTIVATSAKARSYSIGAGYGTDTGARVNLGVNNRRVNKLGHQWRSDLRVSEVSASVQTQYRIPINQGNKGHIAITASATSEKVANIDTDSILLGISRFESWRGFQRQLYLHYEAEKFTVGDQPQSIELLIPGISLSKKVSKNLIFPRQGYSFEIDMHGASESALSDTNFIQASASGSTIFPLGTNGRLLLRGEIGATRAENFDLLPISQRFFTGGDRSVRGYDFQTISPLNEDGERIGGRYLTALSVESDYIFSNNYGLAAFVDAGNATDEASARLKLAAGVGFRYRSPIGMIRLDVARPVDDGDNDGYRLHISIGADL